MDLLAANNLCKTFDSKRAVSGVSLQIQAGQFAALLGLNGAGKSTVINLLIGMMTPDSGDIRFNGGNIFFEVPTADELAWCFREAFSATS